MRESSPPFWTFSTPNGGFFLIYRGNGFPRIFTYRRAASYHEFCTLAQDLHGIGATVRMILTVADPDALFARVLAAGAVQVYPMMDEHGWHVGRVVDPFGHSWEIGCPLS